MKADDKLQILKFLLMLFNSLFVILGVSLFGCSAWILFEKNNFITVISSEADVKVVAGGLFVIGLVVVCVSVLGCVGVQLENRCFIAIYMGLLIVIVFGQLFITFLLLIKRNKIETVLTESIDGIIAEYGVNNSETWWLLDRIQQSVKCCGRKNASDWETNKYIQALNMTDVYPCSCFNGSCPVIHTSLMFGNGSNINTKGCGVKLQDWFQQNILVIVGMDLGLLAIQILQFALGVHIYRNITLKMKDHHPRNLLNAIEEDTEPQPDLQENIQPDQAYDQQLPDGYTQEHAGLSFYQHEDQPHQHPPDLQANSHLFNQQHNSVYNQDEAGEAYDQYQHQHYQHHHDLQPTTHIYHKHGYTDDHRYAGQEYDQYQDQYNQYSNKQDHPQAYGNYNQGYSQSYDARNNYDDY